MRVGSGITERKNVKGRGRPRAGEERERERERYRENERETKSFWYITRELAC